jgi:hypothetical protein
MKLISGVNLPLTTYSLKLKNYEIKDFEKESEDTVIIHVSRVWEDGSEDVTSYSLLMIKDKWKIDNRI